MVDEQSTVFSHFSLISNQADKFGPIAIVAILKRINSPDYDVGAHKNPKMVIYRAGFFYKYLKIYKWMVDI